MKNKQLRAWLILLAWQLTWIIPIGIAESQKEQVEEPQMITEYEDVVRWRIDDVDEEIYVEEVKVDVVKKAPELVSLGRFKLTAYCPCKKCTSDGDGITASGTVATQGRTVAVDPRIIPYGTVLIINGHEYIAEDCSVNYIHGKEIDIFMDSHSDALAWGIQYAEVYVKVESNE